MDLNDPAIEQAEVAARNENTVRQGFMPKLRRVIRIIPFAPELLAAYYCALDPQTPTRAKAVLLAALAYFVIPTDLIPDFIFGLGFADDLSVLTAAYGMVRRHVTDAHRKRAERYLGELP